MNPLARPTCLVICLLAFSAYAQDAATRHITQGRARTVIDNLYTCPGPGANHRITALGEIVARDGAVITVPAETALGKRAEAGGMDLYNECGGITPASGDSVDSGKAPLVVIDPDGEVITGYIVADNYFEFFVNGRLVARDSVPYTPFNSTIVRFKARRPLTYAFKLVDWEENLGLGTELNRDNPYHPGDGGLIARFSDGTVTDATWKAQSFYIAPLQSPDDVVESPGNVHDTSRLGRTHPHVHLECTESCFAVHYPIPADWAASGFDDSRWPIANLYTDSEVGVTGLPAYTRYPQFFAPARWIWTNNLVLDNVVIARKTVR